MRPVIVPHGHAVCRQVGPCRDPTRGRPGTALQTQSEGATAGVAPGHGIPVDRSAGDTFRMAALWWSLTLEAAKTLSRLGTLTRSHTENFTRENMVTNGEISKAVDDRRYLDRQVTPPGGARRGTPRLRGKAVRLVLGAAHKAFGRTNLRRHRGTFVPPEPLATRTGMGHGTG
jgi:hypothetical protein